MTRVLPRWTPEPHRRPTRDGAFAEHSEHVELVGILLLLFALAILAAVPLVVLLHIVDASTSRRRDGTRPADFRSRR